MPINFEDVSQDIISSLKQYGYSEQTIAAHRYCYDGLKAHFTAIDVIFSTNLATLWIEEKSTPGHMTHTATIAEPCAVCRITWKQEVL